MSIRFWPAALCLLSAHQAAAYQADRWQLIAKPALETAQIARVASVPGSTTTFETSQLPPVAEKPPEQKPPEQKPTGAEAEAEPKAPEPSRWIVGLGAGARIGFGEPTYPEVYGRFGYAFNKDVGVSVRPRYIFGNIDLAGNRNSEGAFQIPLTIDYKPLGPVNPYFGAGIATNTDSTGETNAILSAGVDIRLVKNLRADASINYIFENSRYDENGRDIEASVVLYYKF
jgi:hypothetical protein